MKYPGRVIKQGETDKAIVAALRTELVRVLVLQPGELGAGASAFDATLRSAVKLFQSRNVDGQGNPLKIDGEVGSITWGALFGPAQVPTATAATDDLLAHALVIAASEEARQVRERPPARTEVPRWIST